MKIVLLGYMGSGKSVVGKILSKEMKISFIDLDNYIEKKENKTIKEIFKTKGEIYFRKIEKKYLKEVMFLDIKAVISLGGGTPCFGNNMEVILKNGVSFYLKASAKTLAERLRAETVRRPLLSTIRINIAEYIAKHLFERSVFYEKANYTIDAEKTPNQVVEQIKVSLK